MLNADYAPAHVDSPFCAQLCSSKGKEIRKDWQGAIMDGHVSMMFRQQQIGSQCIRQWLQQWRNDAR